MLDVFFWEICLGGGGDQQVRSTQENLFTWRGFGWLRDLGRNRAFAASDALKTIGS